MNFDLKKKVYRLYIENIDSTQIKWYKIVDAVWHLLNVNMTTHSRKKADNSFTASTEMS